MIRFAIALILTICTLAPAAASTICQADRAPRTADYWQWRMVDGKKCWYRGHAKLEKSQLRWSAGVARATRKANDRRAGVGLVPKTPSVIGAADLQFAERWVDLPAAREAPQEEHFDFLAFASNAYADQERDLLSVPLDAAHGRVRNAGTIAVIAIGFLLVGSAFLWPIGFITSYGLFDDKRQKGQS
jgi:hypothetical protein